MGRVIGLTGGVGTGKTTVTAMLAKLGAAVVDADAIGHQVLAEKDTLKAVVAAFGKDILNASGTIDRGLLARLVFCKSANLETLNRLLHPRIYALVEAEISALRDQDRVVVLDAPLLIEAGWTALVDEVWLTVATQCTVIRRVRARTGLSEGAIRARIKTQLEPRHRIRWANVIINTECNLLDLEKRVCELYRERFRGTWSECLPPA